MNGSGTIQVRKLDESEEAFDRMKLAGAMWRVLKRSAAEFRHARDLAGAIETYLRCTGREWISSSALFEMVLRVLRKVHLDEAAEAMEVHRLWRIARREALLVFHDEGRITFWDKQWLCQNASSAWGLSRAASRNIAAHVEAEILSSDEIIVTREQVLEKLNTCVAAFGLADAVPVEPHATQA